MKNEQTDTRSRILDAAENMFAERGFDAVPVREIMDAANAKLGLFSYHFGSKDNLFEQVIARRIDVLNDLRRKALADVLGRATTSVDDVVRAFVRPYLDLMTLGGDGWHAYGRLIAQVAQSRKWNPLVHRYFDETASLFVDALQQQAPSTGRPTIIRTFVFSVGLMLNVFASSGRMASLSNGEVDDEALEDSYNDLIAFMSSGIKGTLGIP